MGDQLISNFNPKFKLTWTHLGVPEGKRVLTILPIYITYARCTNFDPKFRVTWGGLILILNWETTEDTGGKGSPVMTPIYITYARCTFFDPKLGDQPGSNFNPKFKLTWGAGGSFTHCGNQSGSGPPAGTARAGGGGAWR